MGRFVCRTLWMFALVGVLWGWSAPAVADESEGAEALEEASGGTSEDFEGEEGRRIAVVALGQGPQSGSAIETLQTLLDERGFEVIDQEALRERIDESKVPETSPEVANEFVDLTDQIAAGIEKFFYKGNEEALEALTPALNLGMAHPDLLARRPDFSSQIYETGVVMIRAYRNLERTDDARHLASALTTMFPGVDGASESTPPDVVQLLSEARKDLEEADARLKIDMIEGDGCKPLVNGVSVGEDPLPVRPDRSYYVTMECGSGVAPLWKVEVGESETLEVPVARKDPLDLKMDGGGYSDRHRVEEYLKTILHWGQLTRVIGVADAEVDEDPSSFVLVHAAEGHDAGWSDRADETEASRMLARVMPDYDADDGVAGASRSGGPDWLSWSMVSGGVLSLGLGSWGLLASERRATAIACSSDSSAEPSSDQCEGVDRLTFSSDEELQEGEREVTTTRILSGAGLLAGIGLAGWGTYRLLSGGADRRARSAVEFDVELSPTRAGLTTTFRF